MTKIILQSSLLEQLDAQINAHRSRSTEFGLLLVRIDDFRKLNIARGRQTGNQVLKLVSGVLAEVCRDQDQIYRSGVAEFLIVIQNLHNEGHASLAALKISNRIEQQQEDSPGIPLFNIRIGIVTYPGQGQDADQLLSHLDQALIGARHSLAPFQVYSREQQDEHLSWDITSALNSAIDNDEFQLYFQPQIALQDDHVSGAEALIRWKHPQRGYVRPDYFIPLAEQFHLIEDITDWTIRHALWQSQQWPHKDGKLKVSVNLSPRALDRDDLADSIMNAAGIFSIEPENLILEITETSLMNDIHNKIRILERLKSYGIGISIDDFGTGFSSMEYLKNIPADELKIDKSFVINMLDNKMDRHIVQSVIDIARGFDIEVVAEGIENRETYDTLKEMGCQFAQGYYISAPLSQANYIDWVRQYSDVCEELET